MPSPGHGRRVPVWHGRPAARRRALFAVLAAGVTFAIAVGAIAFALRPQANPVTTTDSLAVPGSRSTAVPEPDPVAAAQPLAQKSFPVGIMISSVGVDAPVMSVSENSDGTMAIPPATARNLAGWFDGGPAPGQRGPAVILGRAADGSAKAVFYAIGMLSRGAQIDISLADGQLATFAVDGVQRVTTARFPTKAVYGPLTYPGLRLITESGPDTIVVYAHLVN